MSHKVLPTSGVWTTLKVDWTEATPQQWKEILGHAMLSIKLHTCIEL
jgi:hypothetical protein